MACPYPSISIPRFSHLPVKAMLLHSLFLPAGRRAKDCSAWKVPHKVPIQPLLQAEAAGRADQVRHSFSPSGLKNTQGLECSDSVSQTKHLAWTKLPKKRSIFLAIGETAHCFWSGWPYSNILILTHFLLFVLLVCLVFYLNKDYELLKMNKPDWKSCPVRGSILCLRDRDDRCHQSNYLLQSSAVKPSMPVTRARIPEHCPSFPVQLPGHPHPTLFASLD